MFQMNDTAPTGSPTEIVLQLLDIEPAQAQTMHPTQLQLQLVIY